MAQDKQINSERMNSVAEDALTIFRVNLFLVGICVSIAALLYRAGEGNLQPIADSSYTRAGGFFIIGSLFSTIVAYRGARFLAAEDVYENETSLSSQSPSETIQMVTASALGTLLGVICIGVGTYDGLFNESVPAALPIAVVFLSFMTVVIVPGLLSVIVNLLIWLNNIGGEIQSSIADISDEIKSYIRQEIERIR